MTTVMTHIAYNDAHATVPGTDTSLGAWLPLTDDQRIGAACLDCDKQFFYNSAKCGVGRAELAGVVDGDRGGAGHQPSGRPAAVRGGEVSVQAIVRRPTAEDSDCHRCYAPIVAGEVAGYVEPGLHRIPWAAGTVLCSHCADHLAYKYLRGDE